LEAFELRTAKWEELNDGNTPFLRPKGRKRGVNIRSARAKNMLENFELNFFDN
jgi:hypothetical protein